MSTVKPVYNTSFGTPKKWPLYKGSHSVEVLQSELLSKLAWPDLVWLMLTGSHCSEVTVTTGLPVDSQNITII